MNTPFKLVWLIVFLLYGTAKAQTVSYTDLHNNSTFNRSLVDLSSKAVGAINGAAEISPSGAVTYSIPLDLPVGTNGMMPRITLVYNSQSGAGIIGQGWNISGLSAINRAGNDLYHDGKVGPVSYTNADAFVLDGARLSVKSGTNGANLATYRTEAETYAAITSYETLGGGPKFFNVVAKDGTLMQYGNSDDSRFMSDDGSKVMMWRINKMLDLNGNYIWFTYENAGRNPRIKEIKYTGNENTGLEPYLLITFNYGTRDDQNTAYDGGYSMKTGDLLTSIRISEIGTNELFKNYSFWYGKNNGASYLKAVYEHNAAGETLNDTRFQYGDNVAEREVNSSNLDVTFTSATSTGTVNNDIFSGDFDGDGKTEVLKAAYNYMGGSTYYDRNYLSFQVFKEGTVADNYSVMSGSSISIPTAPGGRYLVNYQKNRNIHGQNFITSDFNGDGKDDLLFVNITADIMFNGVSIYESKMGTSSPGFEKKDIPPATVSASHQMIGENILLLGDFDGDKRSDYLYVTRHKDPGTGIVYDHVFVSFPGKPENNQPIMQLSSPSQYDATAAGVIRNGMMGGITSKVYVLDFDGDGISEIMCSLTDAIIIYKLDKTSSGVYHFRKLMDGSGYPTERYQEIKGIGDFNGDGKSDLIVNSKANRSIWEIAYSDGKTFQVVPFYFKSGSEFQSSCSWSTGSWPFKDKSSGQPDELFIGDYNGDGKSDLLHVRKYCNNDYDDKTDFIYYYFYGKKGPLHSDIIKEVNSFTHPYGLSDIVKPILTDINGDGKQEFSFKNISESGVLSTMQTLYFHKAGESHLLKKVNDGLNRTTAFSYQPLTKGTGTGAGDFYTRGTGETYPVNNSQLPMYVATEMSVPDGIGGTQSTSYKYENLRLHREGRGLLGFEKVRSVNTVSNIRTESVYELNRDFYVPYLKTSKSFWNSTGEGIAQSDQSVSFTRISTGYCYIQTNPSTVTYDLDMGTTTTTEHTIDGNGNLTLSVSTTTGGPETLITRNEFSYAITAGSALPNRPDYSYNEQKRGSNPALGISKTMTYDAKGRLNYIYQAPTGATPATTTIQELLYDDYGNLKQKTDQSVSGHIPASAWPVTRYEYDSRGRFLVKETNPLGDFTTFTTHKFWGKQLSVTGVNGLVTTRTYNDWGKLSSTTIPTVYGASYTINYSTGWDISGNQLYYTLSTDPSGPDVKTWFDNRGRKVKQQQEGFSGWTNALTTYDARGNVLSSTNNYYSTETPEVSNYTYDYRSRVQTVTNFTGLTTYNYSNGSGVKTVTTNMPDGKVKKTATDAAGKLIRSMNNAASTTVHFFYDSRGNEIRTKMGTFTTTYHDLITKEYDALGRLTKLKDPDAGTLSYEYDAFGRLKKETDALGHETSYTYDLVNRILSKEQDGGFATTTYQYHDKLKDYKLKQEKIVYGPSIFYIEDNYDYVSGGAMSLHTRIAFGQLFERKFTYNGYGQLSTTEYTNSGFKKRNLYNSNGFLNKVTTYMSGGTGEKTLYQCSGMNGSGQVTSFSRVDGLPANTSYTHGLPTEYFTPGKQQLQMSYNYANGNMLSRADLVVATQEQFDYDAADRLISAAAEKLATGGGFGMMHAPLTMTYHGNFSGSFGRIETKSDVGTYKYGNFPRNAVASVSDPANQISHETQDIFYRPNHKTGIIAEKVGTVNYKEIFEYDAADERAYAEQWRGTSGGISSTGGSIARKRWYFGDMEVDQDITTGVTRLVHYIEGNDGLCGMVVKTGGTFDYYGVYTDHLGSIVTVTNEAGAAIIRQSFDPWGCERVPDTWGYVPSGLSLPPKPAWLYRGFCGHEMRPEFGLINMNGRMYDPLNGRMLRPDHFVAYPGNSQSYNRYSYALNNPLSYVDPDGNNPILIAAAIAVATSAASYTYNVAKSPGGFANWNWMSFQGSLIMGATTGTISGGAGFMIGGAFGATGSIYNELGRAGAHGLSNYVISGGKPSSFISGAFGSLSGSLSSAVGGAMNTAVGGTAFAAAVSGMASGISGGDMLEGAAIGAIVHVVNQLQHREDDKPKKEEQSKKEAEEVKTGFIGDGRIHVENDYAGDVYFKPEGDMTLNGFDFQNGGAYKMGKTSWIPLDGVNVNGKVYKISNGYDRVYITPTGEVKVQYLSITGRAAYFIKGGLKTKFIDSSWINLFNANKR